MILKAPILTIAVIAGVAAWAMSGEANSAGIRVRCLTRLEPPGASISIDDKDLIARQNHVARIVSGGKCVDAPLTAAAA